MKTLQYIFTDMSINEFFNTLMNILLVLIAGIGLNQYIRTAKWNRKFLMLHQLHLILLRMQQEIQDSNIRIYIFKEGHRLFGKEINANDRYEECDNLETSLKTKFKDLLSEYNVIYTQLRSMDQNYDLYLELNDMLNKEYREIGKFIIEKKPTNFLDNNEKHQCFNNISRQTREFKLIIDKFIYQLQNSSDFKRMMK